jgi:hypothetical protein
MCDFAKASKTAWLTEPCQFFDGTDGPPGAGCSAKALPIPGLFKRRIVNMGGLGRLGRRK